MPAGIITQMHLSHQAGTTLMTRTVGLRILQYAMKISVLSMMCYRHRSDCTVDTRGTAMRCRACKEAASVLSPSSFFPAAHASAHTVQYHTPERTFARRHKHPHPNCRFGGPRSSHVLRCVQLFRAGCCRASRSLGSASLSKNGLLYSGIVSL